MNDQQRAAMIRPRGKSVFPQMVEAYKAMKMALEALEDAHRRDEHSAARWVYSEAMDALCEALAQPQKQIKCACGDAYLADSFGAGFIAATGHCQNCDMTQPQDNLNCKSVQRRLATLWGYVRKEEYDMAIEATKEKAAKVLDKQIVKLKQVLDYCEADEADAIKSTAWQLSVLAAAIRSMK